MNKFLNTLFVSLLLSGCFNSTESVTGKVTGEIRIAKELESTLKPTDVLYIIARAQQVGPPSAVKRIVHPQFPLKYVIGPEDAMMPGMPGFEETTNLTLTARVSRSGSATGAPGDLEGVHEKNPTKPGRGGVDIIINKIRE